MKVPLAIGTVLLSLLGGCTNHSYSLDGDRVKLFLRMPGVETVEFASSLDGYRPRRAERINHRTWVVAAPASGEFSYFYIVDGAPYLPACPFKEKDDFGFVNCLYVPGGKPFAVEVPAKAKRDARGKK